MARSIWTGAISFGLVNVPVKLYSATEEKTVHFHQFDRESGKGVHNKRVAEGTDDEVAFDDIVKGYELEKGTYVMVEPDELEAVEPGRSRTIEIEDFIALDEIDPMYFGKTYYLGPAKGAGAEKPYELLRQALEDAEKVGIARFVMRSKQYLAAVRPAGDVLVLETMYFPDEIRGSDAIENKPSGVRLSDKERKIAAQLIDSLTSEWQPENYHDTYRERVLALIHRKAQGEDIVVDKPEEPDKVLDLMAALEASVQAAKEGRPRPRATAKRGTDGGTAGEKRGAGATRKKAKPADVDLTALSKSELYERAQQQGIEGRAAMSKDDLVEALSRAS